MELSHNGSQLKTFFDVLKDLVTDVNLVFNKNGISVVALDPEKIVGVSLTLDDLNQYQKDVEEDYYIGVNMQHLYKLIRGVGNGHVIHMQINPDTPNVLKIVIDHPTKGTLSTTSLYSLEIEKKQPVLPSIDYSIHGTIPVQDLLKSVKCLSHGTKKITISANEYFPRHLTLAAKGSLYLYTTSVSICPNDEDGLVWHEFNTSTVRGLYLTKYIEKFLKPQLHKTVDIYMSDDGVFLMEYKNIQVGKLKIVMVSILEE